jgi:hypothetical protein
VKSALKKTLGNRCVTKTELETSLCEIEACINGRPLTFEGDEVDCTKPSHFLLGRNSRYQTVVSESESVISQADLSDNELIR